MTRRLVQRVLRRRLRQWLQRWLGRPTDPAAPMRRLNLPPSPPHCAEASDTPWNASPSRCPKNSPTSSTG
ncbi:MAG: hypothetical protein MUC68_12025 [Burkholderiaceae bacterium]|nr:hypothetical protein [Burkholderiaceae bacterium]